MDQLQKEMEEMENFLSGDEDAIDRQRARKTKAYKEGHQNKRDNLNGPNPYCSEGQSFADWELGWCEAETLQEEKRRVDAEQHIRDSRQAYQSMKGGY